MYKMIIVVSKVIVIGGSWDKFSEYITCTASSVFISITSTCIKVCKAMCFSRGSGSLDHADAIVNNIMVESWVASCPCIVGIVSRVRISLFDVGNWESISHTIIGDIIAGWREAVTAAIK